MMQPTRTQTKIKKLFFEFVRYLMVGGAAFVVDFGTLILCKEFLIPDWNGLGLYVSATIAFVFGLLFNYIFSILFVFKVASGNRQGKTLRDFIVFTGIGIIGLGLTNFGMWLGVDTLHINYILSKVAITGVVLVWNFFAKKLIIFRER